MAEAGAAREREKSWLDGALRFVVTALPFAVAVLRTSSSAQWRDDLPAVRDIGLVAVGVGGGVSTIAAQATRLVPLGSLAFRASIVAAAALAIAARIVFDVALDTLRAARPSPRLAPALAAVAALTAALSPTWQREGTAIGGATIAVALSLAALACAAELARAREASVRTAVAFGAALGACFAESPPAGAAALVASAAMAFVLRSSSGAPWRTLDRRALHACSLSATAMFALLAAPLALRPLAPRVAIDIGRALSASSLLGADVASARTTALAAWTREVGVVSLGVASLGLAFALAQRKLRHAAVAALVIVGLDALFPARAQGALSADSLSALRALAIAAVAVASSIGAQAAIRGLLSSRVPMAKSASVLVFVFHLTLVALTSEEAGFAADRSEQLAAETWTDEALAELPPRASALVRSPALAFRLWSARVVRGERPDVLVLPIPLLGRGSVTTLLLSREPRADDLVRDFTLAGEPSEFGMSKLADVRPLFVELDRSWPLRLAQHLLAEGMWLEYGSEPKGASDRRAAAASGAPAVRRVTAALLAPAVPDFATSSVLAASLRAQANVLAYVGDDDAAEGVLAKLDAVAIDPSASTVPSRYAISGIKRAVARRFAASSPRARAPAR